MIIKSFFQWSKLGNNFLLNIDCKTWCRLLRRQGWRISPAYWHRALLITLLSPLNSLMAYLEKRRFALDYDHLPIPADPVFIVGHWRTGTTLLHNILAQDPAFDFVDTYEATNPRTFLLNGWRKYYETLGIIPAVRPMDNMDLAPNMPQEEDLAMMLLDNFSPIMCLAFPKAMAAHIKTLRFHQHTPQQIAQWKTTYLNFLKKVSVLKKKRLVLKSPTHTGRIRYLLEIFPNAQFIHIKRHPKNTLLSTLHTHNTLGAAIRLQSVSQEALQDGVVAMYQALLTAYTDDISLLQERQIYEVDYEAFVQDPMRFLQEMYTHLALGNFAKVQERFATYLQSLHGYKANTFATHDQHWIEALPLVAFTFPTAHWSRTS